MKSLSSNTKKICPSGPLLSFPSGCLLGRFVRREKRFSVALETEKGIVWIHSNNSGSMLGLTRPGCLVLASRADNPRRKLHFTQEAVLLEETTTPHAPLKAGYWVGVDTGIPNRMLEAAFLAHRLPFAQDYTEIRREVPRGNSRLDACFTAAHLPPLWVECKNVTMVEDDVACFPDAVTLRGQKHLLELMDIVRDGARAAMFFLVQRPDGHCFGPADFIDLEYAKLYWQALLAGVEMYPYRASITPEGIDLGAVIPLQASP